MFLGLPCRRVTLLVPGWAIYLVRSGGLALAAVLVVNLAHAQPPDVSANQLSPSHVITTWQQEQGLSQRAITAVLQTRDGYLWLGTYNGLVRFDGVRFTVFDEGSTPALWNERITSLCEDAAGALWLGHESGELTRMADGGFTPVPTTSAWTGREIMEMASDNQGSLWLVGPPAALARLTQSLIQSQPPVPAVGVAPWTLAARPGQDPWLVLEKGLARFQAGAWQLVANTAPPEGKVLRRACPSGDGGWWVAGDDFLRQWRDANWVEEIANLPWGNGLPTAMIETRAGVLCVGTLAGGLFLRRPGGDFEQVSTAQGLTANWVRSFCEDREGNLWVGTSGGLNALRPRLVESHNFPADLGDSVALPVCVAREGGLWVGTEGRGLLRFQDGRFTRPEAAATLPNPYVWSLLETKTGELWAGTWGGGLRVWRGNQWETPAGFAGRTEPVLALCEGRASEVWIGTRSGLARWTPQGCTWITGTNSSTALDVRSIAVDAAGRVWFGLARGGLRCWDGDFVMQYGRAQGLPSESVWVLLTEPDGTLWIGTRTGLARLKRGQITALGQAQGLPANFISHLADDGRGRLWFGSDKGIFCASKADLNRCADGQLPRVECLTYGRAEGLNSTACSGGFQPAGCRTPDGCLWFPTRKGIVALDPASVTTNLLAPPVVIEALLVDGVSCLREGEARQQASDSSGSVSLLAPWPEQVEITPGWHDLEFQFTGLSFVAPQKVRFRWQLEGWEPDWVEGGNARQVSYRFLPPGHYHFRVTACNNDGVWDPTGATLAFRVRPAFWQTWWFRGASAAGVLAALVGTALVVQRRKYRLQLAELERRRAVERERLRIAQDIHDEVGSSLTRVGMLAESAEAIAPPDDQNRARIQGIAATTRQIVQAMDEIVWAVNPRNDTLTGFANYLVHFAEDFLRHSGVQFRLQVPVRLPERMLPADARHNLFLAAKEALHNAVKHARAREIELRLACEQDRLTVTVHDDGQGFDPTVVESAGDGLRNMRERVESLGGRVPLDSGPSRGTTRELDLPVPP